ncbi:alpha/beta-hydrolase [Trametes coccinea BRFM310]|uniref:Alpha/beta-hydrolase n=1 Tax=Trametes coccinea (strain BRFM310) TaxID=1353009 RepID=A0A1Y2J343_TRAC3|nr:alpha/beta-hydrolase [Trametes coccinea BRFM310]
MSYETKTIIRKYPSQHVDEPLHFVAKRYIPTNPSPTGLTLLFFHCTGSHKEVWEPVIQRLFELARQGPSKGFAIREAWTWDWQTHGEAGRLNAAVIACTKEHIVASELVYGVKRFAATEGVFEGHTLAGVGHSSGATSLMLTTVDDAQPGLKYKAIIIMEPSTLTRESATEGDIHEKMRALRGMIEKRRNTWKSREEARRYFQARLPWKKWDPRTFDLFLNNALMEQTVQKFDGTTASQITLCCAPFQEGAAYYGHGEIHYAAAERLGTLNAEIPVHVVFVTPAETMPETQRNSVLQLRKFASITLLPNVGHLLVQEKPDMVTSLIYDKLAGVPAAQAKL